MTTLLTYLYQFLTSRWSPIAWVLSAVAVLYANVMGILDVVNGYIVAADSIVAPVFSGSGVSVSVFAFMNYLLPLDAALAMFHLWVPFYLLCNSFRFIKAFIPTIAS